MEFHQLGGAIVRIVGGGLGIHAVSHARRLLLFLQFVVDFTGFPEFAQLLKVVWLLDVCVLLTLVVVISHSIKHREYECLGCVLVPLKVFHLVEVYFAIILHVNQKLSVFVEVQDLKSVQLVYRPENPYLLPNSFYVVTVLTDYSDLHRLSSELLHPIIQGKVLFVARKCARNTHIQHA
jgi:hypothetical protein